MIQDKLLDVAFDTLLEIDATVDVPFIPMDKSIATNIEAPPTRQDGPIRIKIRPEDEDKEEEDELEESPPPFAAPMPGGKPGGMSEDVFFEQEAPGAPGVPQDIGGGGIPPGGGTGDPNQDVMDIANPEASQLSDPGKGLELKKIFSRLLALQNFLSSTADEGLSVLRDYISKAIELFRTVIDNLASYKEKVDDIIVLFYDFIERCYMVLKEYYKAKIERSKKTNG